MRKPSSILLMLAFVGPVYAEGVGWRTDGTGQYPDARPPLDFSHEIWKTAMSAPSNASPVVIDDRLFVLEEPTTVTCLDRATGKVLWRRSNDYEDVLGHDEGSVDFTLPPAHGHNGFASATPVSDGKYVWAVFGTGVVVCYDVEGERQWARVPQRPTHRWGHSASPRLIDGKLIVSIIDLFAFDALTGRTVWRTRSENHFGTPALTHIDSTPIILSPSGQIIRAGDGKVLSDDLPRMSWNGPLVVGDKVYCIETTASAWQLPARADEPFELKHLWTTSVRGDRHYASPIVHQGLVYTVSRQENLTVLDIANGDLVYRRKLEMRGDKTNSVYTSVILADRWLFVGCVSGKFVVFEPGTRYKEVARNDLERLRSTPVFFGDRMYARGLDHVWCIGGARGQ